MISKLEIRDLVHEDEIEQEFGKAELAFKDCFAKLTHLESAKDLLSFQPTLIEALYRLESLYKKVCKEERELISRKAESNPKAFSERMQTLDRYKNLLKEAVDVGKMLGDAFAWIFYERETNHLAHHYEHEFIPHLATGVGGKGELEFARKIPIFGKYLVISHSITTFLRQGDVSLIDLKTLKVAAIGELKTRSNGSQSLITTIVLASGTKLPKENLPQIPANHRPLVPIEPFPPWLLERLKRQMQNVQKTFDTPTPMEMPEQLSHTIDFSTLTKLFKNSCLEKWGYVKVDRGLALIGIRFEMPSLYTQLNGKFPAAYQENYERNLELMKSSTMEITDKTLPDNSITLGWIPRPAHSRYRLHRGMRPLFWWPVDRAVREALIFQQMRVMTIFNPAFVLQDFRNLGWEVNVKEDRIEIHKKYGKSGNLKIVGINYFLNLIQTNLFSEKAVVNMILKSTEHMEKMNLKQSASMDLNFDYIFS